MPKHIGIVGCSAEGAALCYRTICAEAAKRTRTHAHPEITMHTPSLQAYVDALGKGELDRVAELMLNSAAILKHAGAEFLICPDNTIHQAFGRVERHSDLPWLHIAQVTAAEAKRQGRNRLGILGKASLVRSDLYPSVLEKHGIQAIRAPEADIHQIDRIIFEELVPGQILNASRQRIRTVIDALKGQGCDGVVLGCTEIPLIVAPEDSVLPVFDTTRLLAQAALNHAMHG